MPFESQPLRVRLALLTRALETGDPAQLLRGAQLAYALAFGLTAGLGALLGLLGLWWQPLELKHPAATWALTGTAVLLAALTFRFSGQSLRRGLTQASEPRQRRSQLLTAAFGLSAAPAIPWLLACAALPRPLLALGLVALTALIYALGHRQLGQWLKLI
ncbi:hypothetical protein GCM10017783_05600 [Deinococcus piscis]|uniref:Uncharacterized protein n=1 Tax=Deinococcus piscis TaxID=394230 RepID=A0ABQ3JZ16_9DEIO|nr:hypothetical protein [Deinococcus piscis]GHF96606.1 hypothetical protein GCM10017783_05600 [Deinococcus piscis]